MGWFSTVASEKFLNCSSPCRSFGPTVNDLLYIRWYQLSCSHPKLPYGGTCNNSDYHQHKVLGPANIHPVHWLPHSWQPLGPVISITRVSWPWQRVFVLGDWLELPTECLCQAGLQDSQPSAAKWKCSTSHCPQPESTASCSFVERNIRPEKYQSRRLPADITTKMLLDICFTVLSSEDSREKQKANNTKGHVESFALVQKPDMVLNIIKQMQFFPSPKINSAGRKLWRY